MHWSDYYEKYDSWQESTQYSRLASIDDWGDKTSPGNEIADAIMYVNEKTAESIIRKAAQAKVYFHAGDILDIFDSGQISDENLLSQLLGLCYLDFSGEQMVELLDIGQCETEVLHLIGEMCKKKNHFTDEEVADLLERVYDSELQEAIVLSTDTRFSEDTVNQMCDLGLSENVIRKASKNGGIPYQEPEDISLDDDSNLKKPSRFFKLMAFLGMFGDHDTHF